MHKNPQYGNVGNLGDILKHAALINLLKLLTRHHKSGFAYIETHTFLLNSPCSNPARWLQEVNAEIALHPSYKDYLDAELAIMDYKPYRCSAGLAIDTLKMVGINNPSIILAEKNPDTRATLEAQLRSERQDSYTLLEDASHFNRLHLPDKIDTLFILVDPFELDNFLWEEITDSLKTMVTPGLEVILEVFTYDKSRATVTWPSSNDAIIGPVSVMCRRPYHLATYCTRGMRADVTRCCSLLGWRESQA
ncbi:MAG: hypothetical protein ACLPN1_11815 [Dissulfurispiraceae bacterium]